MARALRDSGYKITVAANETTHRGRIEDLGFDFVHWPFQRGAANLFVEARSVISLFKIVRNIHPDAFFSIGMKPILYGGIARLFAQHAAHVSLFSGLGSAFNRPSKLLKIIRWIALKIFNALQKDRDSWIIVQNDDDMQRLQSFGIGAHDRCVKIRGSGVDLEAFPVLEPPSGSGKIKISVVSRMIWDKGIAEAIAAAKMLEAGKVDFELALVGDPDPLNPNSIDENYLRASALDSPVDWVGHTKNIQQVWESSHIALLPSYGEGMPKALLEAAASARPLVAFDVSGCRELVEHERNGLLVEFGNVRALADALRRLCESAKLRRDMGLAARRTVEDGFSNQVVGRETVAVFDRALSRNAEA